MRFILFRSVIALGLFAPIAGAQSINTLRPATGATVSGVVFDSIAKAPLAGAIVQLVAADNPALLGRTTTSDAIGEYTLSDVPAGRYALGFLHPMLDSLGVDIPPRNVNVASGQSFRVDVGIPSPARLRAAICGPSRQDSIGVLIGFVRDAQAELPLPGVTVTAEWLEFTLGRAGVVRATPRRVATTGENGWFVLCNVPSGGIVALVAAKGADSTGRIEVQVPVSGFARRELYLGATQTVVLADAIKRADSVRIPPRKVHVGNGRIDGTVVAAVRGNPLANALVSITTGPQTRTNERGEWTIANAPAGTRMLEVRAIGFYPVLRQVDIVAGAPPVLVALSTMQAVLDTVRITAKGVIDVNMIGFLQRRRSSGSGRFLTADDISRHAFVETTEILRLVPGLYVERVFGGETVTMRGAFGLCLPSVYIDGRYMSGVSASEIGDWIMPRDIAGIEVYTDSVPPQFQEGLAGCGSIVLWRK